MREVLKATTGYMALTAIIGIVLGAVMLAYPGGTMELIASAFWVFQAMLAFFFLYYTLSEAVCLFSARSFLAGAGWTLIGVLAAVLVWLLDVGFVYWVIAFFLILSGMGEIASSFTAPSAKLFLAFLGILNVFVGVLVISNPLILPLLVAWYVLFWGISRFFLACELRRAFRD